MHLCYLLPCHHDLFGFLSYNPSHQLHTWTGTLAAASFSINNYSRKYPTSQRMETNLSSTCHLTVVWVIDKNIKQGTYFVFLCNSKDIGNVF